MEARNMDINLAKPFADQVLTDLRPHCHRAEIAGSVRRMKANVKDIELVAQVRDWEPAFRALEKWGYFIKPGCPEITPWAPKANARYLRMMLNNGLKLDLFITSPENWGALFMMRTGSGVGPDGNPFEGFVPGMFSRWKKVSGGGRMIGGHPTLPDGRKVIVREESDYFRICGVQWVEPEERTSRSSIKPIPRFNLQQVPMEFK